MLRIFDGSASAILSFRRGSKTRVRQTSYGSQPPVSGAFSEASAAGDGLSMSVTGDVNNGKLASRAALVVLILQGTGRLFAFLQETRSIRAPYDKTVTGPQCTPLSPEVTSIHGNFPAYPSRGSVTVL